MFKKRQSGFTLIELLVVIAIIGILSSVVLASLNSARKKSRDARRVADVRQLQLALELYYDANSSKYPTALSALAPTYIAAVPNDPGSNLAYAYVGLQGSASAAATCGSYHLGTKIEDTTANSTLLANDIDATVGGTFGTGVADGPVCTGSAWAGNADIAAASSDFDGSAAAVYDVRP